MKILLIDTNVEKDSLFKNEFVDSVYYAIKNLSKYIIIKHYKEDFDENAFDKVIICGNPLGVKNHLKDRDYFNWLLNYNKPLLGICSGFQIISTIYNFKFYNIELIGEFRNQIMEKNILFNNDFSSYFLTIYSVEKNSHIEVFSTVNEGIISSFKIKNKNIYACLFHPEVLNKDILENFIKNTN